MLTTASLQCYKKVFLVSPELYLMLPVTSASCHLLLDHAVHAMGSCTANLAVTCFAFCYLTWTSTCLPAIQSFSLLLYTHTVAFHSNPGCTVLACNQKNGLL